MGIAKWDLSVWPDIAPIKNETNRTGRPVQHLLTAVMLSLIPEDGTRTS